MMLPPDHTPQTSEIAFGAIDMDTVEKAVGVGMIDPLKVERVRKQIPVRRFIGDDPRVWLDAGSCEGQTIEFLFEDPG